jgi:hypothetical protein
MYTAARTTASLHLEIRLVGRTSDTLLEPTGSIVLRQLGPLGRRCEPFRSNGAALR